MKNKIATVILNWNGSKDTLSCIDSLLSESSLKTDLIIIDNDSSHEQFELLKRGIQENKFSESISLLNFNNKVEVSSAECYKIPDLKIYLIRMKTNYGFSKGCNAGALLSSQLGYEFLLFLNNDTEVTMDSLMLLYNDLQKNTEITAVIPQIRYYYDKNKIWNCGGIISSYGNRRYFYANEDCRNIKVIGNNLDVSFATGCCILFRTNEFISLGMFTEKFFFGEEDIELCLRLKSLNKKMSCNMRSVIFHKVGASITGDHQTILRKAYIHYLNRLVNMKSFLGLKWAVWIFPFMLKIMINIVRINKVSFLDFIKFTIKLFIDAITCDQVDKSKFERILKDGF